MSLGSRVGATLPRRLRHNSAAAAGIATFEDLKIDQVGLGYTIAVSAALTRGATSNPFNVTP